VTAPQVTEYHKNVVYTNCESDLHVAQIYNACCTQEGPAALQVAEWHGQMTAL